MTSLVAFGASFSKFELTLQKPEFLWALLIGPVLGFCVWRSRAELSRGAAGFSLLVRALLIATLLFALAEMRLSLPSDRVCVSALLDVSDSVDAKTRATSRDIAHELLAKTPEKDSVQIVAFGANARIIAEAGAGRPDGAAWDGSIGDIDRQATNVGDALRLAGAVLSPECSGRLLLMSDGHETRGDAGQAIASLARRENRPPSITRISSSSDAAVDVGVLGFDLPEQLRSGESFSFRVRVRSTGPVAGRLSVRVSSAGRDQTFERELALTREDASYEFSATAGDAKVLELTAEWDGRTEDRFRENNRLVIEVPVLGPPEVLVVDSDPAESVALRNALLTQKFEVRSLRPHLLPKRWEDLEKYAFVILSDVPAQGLPEGSAQALVEMVRRGGGLLYASGQRARGSLQSSFLARALPLQSQGRDEERTAGVAMVLVIDRSGSMSGAPLEMAKAACRATLGTLEPTDSLEVIAFDGKPSRAVPMQPVRLRASMDAAIARIQPGGGTEILASLDMAYQDLTRARARKKHIVLLTDGNAESDGIFEVASSAFESGITITSVGLGAGINEALLKMIAEAGGGRFHAVSDPSALPRIFVHETELTQRQEPEEEQRSIVVVRDAEVLKGTRVHGAPLLRGAEPMRLAARPAEALLALDNGDPLLATMPWGLGHTLVWSSDLKGHWASAFLRWSGFPKFIAQLVRGHGRRDHSEIWPIELAFEEGELVASLEAPLSGDRFDNSIVSMLNVSRTGGGLPGGQPDVEWSQAFSLRGPGHYEARLKLPEGSSYWVRASHFSQERSVQAQSVQAIAQAYPEEYVDVRNADGGSTAGSQRVTVDALLEPRPEDAKVTVDLRDWLLGIAACLLVLEVFVRRLGASGGAGSPASRSFWPI